MTEKMNQLMKDVPAIRWTALILLASAMSFRGRYARRGIHQLFRCQQCIYR